MTDVARHSEAVSRPGIDPRTWSTLAIVTAVNVTATGVFCDITTITGIEETATYCPPYAGPSYGLHLPMIANGDFVLVEFPEGDFSAGGRITGRTWDGGHPVPDAVVQNPNDVVLVVQPDQWLRLLVSGQGKIQMGGVDATNQAILGTAYRQAEDNLFDAIATFATAIGSLDPLTAPEAAATLNVAIAAFKAASSAFLSQIVVLK